MSGKRDVPGVIPGSTCFFFSFVYQEQNPLKYSKHKKKSVLVLCCIVLYCIVLYCVVLPFVVPMYTIIIYTEVYMCTRYLYSV